MSKHTPGPWRLTPNGYIFSEDDANHLIAKAKGA